VVGLITSALAGALVALALLGASAAVRVFVGPPAIGYGSYGPGPYWGPGYYGLYAPHDNTRTVKISSKAAEAQVFVNGSYAGTAKENKTSICVRSNHVL
jgi:hypothetical protein